MVGLPLLVEFAIHYRLETELYLRAELDFTDQLRYHLCELEKKLQVKLMVRFELELYPHELELFSQIIAAKELSLI